MRSCYNRKLVADEAAGLSEMDKIKLAARYGRWGEIEQLLEEIVLLHDSRVEVAEAAQKKAERAQKKADRDRNAATKRAEEAEAKLKEFVEATAPEKVQLAVKAELEKEREAARCEADRREADRKAEERRELLYPEPGKVKVSNDLYLDRDGTIRRYIDGLNSAAISWAPPKEAPF